MPPALTAFNLEVRYGNTAALRDVSLTVPAGSSLAVIGPNGSGKSTLLAALAGTIKPSSGSTLHTGPTPAFVLQATDVDQSLPITVRDTVSLARYSTLGLFQRFQAADRQAVDSALARLEIEDLAASQFHELSGGQRQRVLIAQGLAQETDVLLLDEPMTGLDIASHAVVLELIDQELAAGRTVVMSTHNLDHARRCQQVLLLDTGPIAVGTPTEALTEEHLRQASGGNVVNVDGEVVLG